MFVLLLAFLALVWAGFFNTKPGIVILIFGYLVAGLSAFFLLRRTPPNPRALKGTAGHIVGDVKRFDERETVFARVRSLRPGSEQYRTFYEKNPQFEAADNNRRGSSGSRRNWRANSAVSVDESAAASLPGTPF